jgi:hypothetical protein
MLRAFVVGISAALLVAGPAYAQSAAYSWIGYGINVPGSSKCPSYKMTINITVAGDSVKARFQQEGRPERHFETTKDTKGMFRTTAEVGGGNVIQVSGTINGANNEVLLDGYCKFGGTLAKK